MRTLEIGGIAVPVLGQSTWRMGEDKVRAATEAKALLAGLDAGMTLIDTAEMYGGGNTESFLGEALAGRRDDAFLVSKAYPQHGSRAGLAKACEGSLRRLKTDRLDLYLLHWPVACRSARRSRACRRWWRRARSAPGASAISMSTTWRAWSPRAATTARRTRSSTT